MLNFGWAEMLVIGVVALIVIGPEDLPDMFRQLGRFTGKLRSMSREFSRAMEQAAKETGVRDVAKDLRTATSPKALGLEAVKSAADKFEKWDPIKNAAKPSNPAAVGAKPLVPPPMPAMPKPTEPKILPEAESAATEPMAAPGSATQALYDKKVLRAQVLAEQTAKLKAIEEGTYQPTNVAVPATSKPKRAAKPKADTAPADGAAEAEPKKRKASKKAGAT